MHNAANTAIERAADLVGGQAALARLLNVKPPTVNQWARGSRPIPVEQCMPIATATKGLVPVWELRPDDWHRIWPMLIDAEGAPPIPAANDEKARAAS